MGCYATCAVDSFIAASTWVVRSNETIIFGRREARYEREKESGFAVSRLFFLLCSCVLFSFEFG